MNLIVTRHPGVVEFLRRRGISGRLVQRASRRDVAGAVVFGIVPVALAALAQEVNIVELPHTYVLGECSADDLERLGARIVRYTVTREHVYPHSRERWVRIRESHYVLPTD